MIVLKRIGGCSRATEPNGFVCPTLSLALVLIESLLVPRLFFSLGRDIKSIHDIVFNMHIYIYVFPSHRQDPDPWVGDEGIEGKREGLGRLAARPCNVWFRLRFASI